MNPHEVTCNKILSCMNDYKNMQFPVERFIHIFIYNLDIYECNGIS